MKKRRKHRVGIRIKMLGAFFIPVLFLILLGVMSYRQTSGALSSMYRDFSMQILGKSTDYLEVLMLDVETTAYDISVDTDDVNYFSGTPDEGVD